MPSDTTILTYKYRIKDSVSKDKLRALAGSVNFVWNYINDLSYRHIKEQGKFLSGYNIDKFTSGSNEELGLRSSTIQEISRVYANNRRTFKKNKLAWRSAKKKTLGWIPFKAKGILFYRDSIKYFGHTFRFYASRKLPSGATIKIGSFTEDSKGRWYVCITFSVPKETQHPSKHAVGIDLGIQNKIALSNGEIFTRDSITKQYEKQLATAQRANKKRQIRNIQAKIANSRRDWTHKITTDIANRFSSIFVGDLKTTDFISATEKSAESNSNYLDSSIYQIKSFLNYKVSRLGGEYIGVNEAYSTQKCNVCKQLTGPKGEKELYIREWICSHCGTNHSRDQNAAINILDIGVGKQTAPEENACRIGHYSLLYKETDLKVNLGGVDVKTKIIIHRNRKNVKD